MTMWLTDINRDIRAGLLRVVPGPVWDWLWRQSRERQRRASQAADEHAAVEMSYYSEEMLAFILQGAHFRTPRDDDTIRRVHIARRLKRERWKQEMEAGK